MRRHCNVAYVVDSPMSFRGRIGLLPLDRANDRFTFRMLKPSKKQLNKGAGHQAGLGGAWCDKGVEMNPGLAFLKISGR